MILGSSTFDKIHFSVEWFAACDMQFPVSLKNWVILYLKMLPGLAKYIVGYLLLTFFYKIWSVLSFIFSFKCSKIPV
jgi:hypothetical protein